MGQDRSDIVVVDVPTVNRVIARFSDLVKRGGLLVCQTLLAMERLDLTKRSVDRAGRVPRPALLEPWTGRG